ncbi:chloride nucleotide-sensitive channel icln [Dermatophagoides pteronyssinus]|uniref:chloride nucleotide-sensitive channel icln n=1 Tax=Dermatophagoides pteronyssinus TaxID=6956 RepID=UPI003F6640D3
MLVLSSIELPNVDDDHVEHVKHLEPQTLAFITTTTTTTIQNQNQNNHQLLGEGTLFIGEDRFTWRTENGQGFSLEYPQISLHATSRDLNNFHSECLYLMFENNNNIISAQQPSSSSSNDDQDENNDEDEDDDDEGNNNKNIIELRLVPKDLSKLDLMYQALSECQLMHPDPDDDLNPFDDNDDDENGEFFGNFGDDNDGDDNDDGQGQQQEQEQDDERMDYTNGQFDDAH